MTKIVMILMMFGAHADTGKNVSKASAVDSYQSIEACESDRDEYMTLASKKLIKNDWIVAEGKIKISHFNIVCLKYQETIA